MIIVHLRNPNGLRSFAQNHQMIIQGLVAKHVMLHPDHGSNLNRATLIK